MRLSVSFLFANASAMVSLNIFSTTCMKVNLLLRRNPTSGPMADVIAEYSYDEDLRALKTMYAILK